MTPPHGRCFGVVWEIILIWSLLMLRFNLEGERNPFLLHEVVQYVRLFLGIRVSVWVESSLSEDGFGNGVHCIAAGDAMISQELSGNGDLLNSKLSSTGSPDFLRGCLPVRTYHSKKQYLRGFTTDSVPDSARFYRLTSRNVSPQCPPQFCPVEATSGIQNKSKCIRIH